jgi:hypothetical protein
VFYNLGYLITRDEASDTVAEVTVLYADVEEPPGDVIPLSNETPSNPQKILRHTYANVPVNRASPRAGDSL